MYPAGHLPVGAAVAILWPGPWGLVGAFLSHGIVDLLGEKAYPSRAWEALSTAIWVGALLTLVASDGAWWAIWGAGAAILPDYAQILYRLGIIDVRDVGRLHRLIPWHRLEEPVKLPTLWAQEVAHGAALAGLWVVLLTG